MKREGQKGRIEGRPKNTIKLWNPYNVFFKKGVFFLLRSCYPEEESRMCVIISGPGI